MSSKPVLVTSALPYANGPIHIGHLAGAYLPADIFVRYMKWKKQDVKFICGSDEHGVPITLRARNENKSPQEVVNAYHGLNKKSFQDFKIDFDIYHRTSDPLHHQTASDFFLNLYEKGILEERETEQFFDTEANMFLADRYIKGTCPSCGHTEAYGDQCEKCGASLSPAELIDPRSMLSGHKPEKKKTSHWYLPLDKMQSEWLEEWIKTKQNTDRDSKTKFKSHVYGQCMSWINQGLQPRAVTRDLDWGVKVPLKGVENKVLYVWFDAPIGYISATKALLPQDWEKYWKEAGEDSPRLIHFIGKDNIVFHCIIFPAMLKAHGEYVLPENVPANEFMNLQGDKISTSRNWAVWLHEYLEEFPGREDVLRYVLTANMPEVKDSEFTWEDFQVRNNSELVAILGNFINRVLVLTQKYYDGVVPEVSEASVQNILEQEHAVLLDKINQSPTLIGEGNIEQYNFRGALNALMDFVRAGNKFLTEEEPWKLIKTDPDKAACIIYTGLQLVARYAILMEPFMPFTSEKLFKLLNMNKAELTWEDASRDELIPAGHRLEAAAHLFTRIEDDVIQQQIEKLKKTKVEQEGTQTTQQNIIQDEKPSINFDEFMKLDLRVGLIESAEKVKKADKLLVLQVDVGFEKRTIVSGIAEFFKPEDLVGKKVIVVANLEPRKIRGVVSKGMVLMAENAEGNLALVNADEKSNPGDQVS